MDYEHAPTMKRLQHDIRTWLRNHVIAPSALALVCASTAVALALRSGSGVALASGLLAGVSVAVILLLISWRQTSRYVLSLGDDARDAGVWIMRHAFGKVGDDSPVLKLFPWVRDPQELGGPASRLIREWLEKKGAGAESAAMDQDLAMDLEMAKEFQMSLMNRPHPDVPAVHTEGRLRLQFHHRYKPAMAIGGDFFQITPVSNDCAGIFIADVVGHGIRSALLTGVLRALILNLQPMARNASFYLKEMNRHFFEILRAFSQPVFTTAYYWVADTTARVANFACAGHPAPLLINRDKARVTRLVSPLPHGAALGLLDDQEYPGETVRLIDGNTFVFYTDGVFECRNHDGEEFGMVRLEKVIQANVYKDSPQILDAIMEALEAFAAGAPQEDDICLVAVDVTTTARA